MTAYEFYSLDKSGEPRLFAILPERRRDPRRITEWSVRKWGKLLLDNEGSFKSMYFVRVNVPEGIKK